MSLLGRIVLAAACLAAAEIALLVWLGIATSVWVPIAAVVASALAGSWIMRHYGSRALWRARGELAEGRIPHQALGDSALVFLAALLLMVPGMLTDLAALVLLVPVFRRYVTRAVAARFGSRLGTGYQVFREATQQDEVIDVTVIDPSLPPR